MLKSYFKVDKENNLKRSSFAWKKRRQDCFDRDHGVCQYCHRPKSEYGDAIQPHHRIFKSQGGNDKLDNLATICIFCHRNHGRLKNIKLIKEADTTKINELIRRYR